MDLQLIQRYFYTVRIEKGHTDAYLVVDRVFRPTHIRTDIQFEGLGCFIDEIHVGRGPDSNQLVQPVDAYNWSLKVLNEVQITFYREHGLEGKRLEIIQRYLDKHNLSVPDPGRIDLPTLDPMKQLRIKGRFPVTVCILFVGWSV